MVLFPGAYALGETTTTTNQLRKRADAGLFTAPGKVEPTRNYAHNLLWLNGSQQKVEWRWTPGSEMDSYTVKLWSEDPPQEAEDLYQKFEGGSEADHFLWTVRPAWSSSRMYFFWMVQGIDNYSNSFVSAYFNITDDPAVVQSSISSSSMISSTSTSSTSTPTANAPYPSAVSSTGEKESTTIALGVGLGLGAPLLILLGVLVGLQLARLRGQYPSGSERHASHPGMRSSVAGSYEIPELVVPVELSSPPAKSQELSTCGSN